MDEPGRPKGVLMMRGIASMLEKHHKVQVLDEGIEAAVTLSARYIPARQLPDKSVSVLDTACARVAVSQHAVPAEVDDCRKRIDALTTELEIIDRDETAGYDVEERRRAISAITELEEEEARLAAWMPRWEREKAVVEGILALRAKLREGGMPVDERRVRRGRRRPPRARGPERQRRRSPPRRQSGGTERRPRGAHERLRAKNARSLGRSRASPLILPIVDAQAVASVIGDWTGIPVGRMVRDEIQTVLHLEEHIWPSG